MIADEATHVNNREQLNLSIRYVDDDYVVHEDPIGLCSLPNTFAETVYSVLKDLLLRCDLSLKLCRGQAYDGASVMQGIRSGVATRIRQDVPQAFPVHCLAHSLNVCLQDAGRQIPLLRDALDTVRDIVKLINYSPKRKTLFSEKLHDHSVSCNSSGLKPLCPTRWTVRAEAIDAVIKQYTIIETLDEVHSTTKDEYGLKAGGIVTALEKFDMLFGLQLGHLLFGAAENTSIVLQRKDISVQEAFSAVNVTRSFYQRQRQDDAFVR